MVAKNISSRADSQGSNNKMPIYIPVAARGSVWVCLWMWLWLSCGILGNIENY